MCIYPFTSQQHIVYNQDTFSRIISYITLIIRDLSLLGEQDIKAVIASIFGFCLNKMSNFNASPRL